MSYKIQSMKFGYYYFLTYHVQLTYKQFWWVCIELLWSFFLCQIDNYYKFSNVIQLAILGFFGQLNDYKYGF